MPMEQPKRSQTKTISPIEDSAAKKEVQTPEKRLSPVKQIRERGDHKNKTKKNKHTNHGIWGKMP